MNAATLSTPSTTTDLTLCLSFRRDSMRFAIPMHELVEVNVFNLIRTIPLSEPSLRGLVWFRDCVLPVFDPLLLAGKNKIAATGLTAIVSVNGKPQFGLLADKVGEAVETDTNQSISAPSRIPGVFETNAASEKLLFVNVSALAKAMELNREK